MITKKEFKEAIETVERNRNPCCDGIEVKNIKIKEKYIHADVHIHEDCGEKTTIYRDLEYDRDRLEKVVHRGYI